MAAMEMPTIAPLLNVDDFDGAGGVGGNVIDEDEADEAEEVLELSVVEPVELVVLVEICMVEVVDAGALAVEPVVMGLRYDSVNIPALVLQYMMY